MAQITDAKSTINRKAPANFAAAFLEFLKEERVIPRQPKNFVVL